MARHVACIGAGFVGESTIETLGIILCEMNMDGVTDYIPPTIQEARLAP